MRNECKQACISNDCDDEEFNENSKKKRSVFLHNTQKKRATLLWDFFHELSESSDVMMYGSQVNQQL